MDVVLIVNSNLIKCAHVTSWPLFISWYDTPTSDSYGKYRVVFPGKSRKIIAIVIKCRTEFNKFSRKKHVARCAMSHSMSHLMHSFHNALHCDACNDNVMTNVVILYLDSVTDSINPQIIDNYSIGAELWWSSKRNVTLSTLVNSQNFYTFPLYCLAKLSRLKKQIKRYA